MPDTTGPRSNRNPILAQFRYDTIFHSDRATWAAYWAGKIAAPKPMPWWLHGATVSQQVFAARVLYRYAAVFGGAS